MKKWLDKLTCICYNKKGVCQKHYANVAQLVEQLIRNQQVAGSSPAISSTSSRTFSRSRRLFSSCDVNQIHFIGKNGVNMKHGFLLGLRHGATIGLGYLSVSFAFGIFAVGNGLSVWEAVLISMTNLTSAGQLAGVPIIAAGGNLIELAATQLVINLRYALMSISLSQKLDAHVRLRDRLAIAFANTDEVFAVASSRPGSLCRQYLYGLILLPFACWSLGTLLGALAGNLLPDSIISALGITIYGMFVAIVVPAAKTEKPIAVCALLSILLSCAFHYIPVLNHVSEGIVIILCAVIASTVLALAKPLPEAKGDVHG